MTPTRIDFTLHLARCGSGSRRSAGIEEDHWDGLDENLEVEPQRPAPHVFQIQLAHLAIGQEIAARHLPQTGDARQHLQAVELPVVVRVELVPEGRSRPYQAHLTTYHIEELRHFIEGGTAQPTPHPRHAIVVDELVNGPTVGPGVAGVRLLTVQHPLHQLAVRRIGSTVAHRPEFPYPEPSPTCADPLLAEEHRAGGV